MNSTALILAYVGVALMVGLAGIASSIGTAICGQTAVGAMKKNGGAFGSYMILSALPGSQGLYGFVCFFMVQTLLTPEITMLQAAAVFGAGLLVGHGINLFMSAISSFVHPMRLTFVEFYKNAGFEMTTRSFEPLTKE